MRPTEHHLDRLAGEFASHWHELVRLLLSRRGSGSLYRRVIGELTPVQLEALSVLAAGDLKMGELAGRLGLAVSSVTRLVDRLEAAGLAERRQERPDRRSVPVGLSTTGSETLTAAAQQLRSLLQELLTPLEPHEQGELLRQLAKISDALNPQAPAATPAHA